MNVKNLMVRSKLFIIYKEKKIDIFKIFDMSVFSLNMIIIMLLFSSVIEMVRL